MSFFSWFMRKPAAKRPLPQPSASSNAAAPASQPGRTHKPAPAGPEHTAATKNERMERRELLYIVVRDAMVCAGVLSASYKFKVLSLDPRGLQFLVMMDLAPEFGGETVRLSEIEALIAQTAKARYGIAVTAVYWRINEHVNAGAGPAPAAKPAAVPVAQPAHPAHPVHPAHSTHSTHSTHAPLSASPVRTPDLARPSASAALARNSMPAPLERPSAAAPVRLVVPRFEPIEADEVAAFKQALASAAARAPTAGAPTPGMAQRSGPRRPAPSNDFADTVMPEQESRAQSLSNTQYGEL